MYYGMAEEKLKNASSGKRDCSEHSPIVIIPALAEQMVALS
jgi:hypothetical protein